MGPTDIAFIVLTLAFLGLLFYALRLRRLLHRYGTFQCALRAPQCPWKVGILHLGASFIEWYPRRSFRMGPSFSFPRTDVTIEGHRHSKLPDVVIVDVNISGRKYEAFMRAEQFAALVSWIDSAPPSEEPLLF